MLIEEPHISIVMPLHKECEQFERTMASLEAYSNEARTTVHIVREGTNVSEARQSVMQNPRDFSQYVCFIDYDSEMIHDGWLDKMFQVLTCQPEAGAVFGGEWWGTEERPMIEQIPGGREVNTGSGMTPAACMLIDRDRISEDVIWDKQIGLRNGWLGGDFEEVDFCYRLLASGLKLFQSTEAQFHHMGGKSTWQDFGRTDRSKSANTMNILLGMKYGNTALNNDDFFSGLEYVKADPNNDDMLGVGQNLRKAYRNVIHRNGLQKLPYFQRTGLA